MKKAVLGLTLIELVVTLAVVSIMLAITTPAVRSFVANNRSSSFSNSLVTALRLARSEAVNRGVSMSLCARNDPASTSSCGSDWSKGWLLFTDGRGSAGAGSIGAGETVVKAWDQPDDGISISAAGGASFVRFLPSGARDPSNGATSLTIGFADCTGNQNRTLSISPSGMISVAKSSC